MALIPDHTHTFTIPVASAEDIREGVNTTSVITPAGIAPFLSVVRGGLKSVLDYALPGDTSISQAFNRAFEDGLKAMWLPPADVPYNLTTLTIPEGTLITAKGATLRLTASQSGSAITIDMGANSYIDELLISDPGTSTNSNVVYMREGSRIGYIKAIADVPKSAGGYVRMVGSDTRIDSYVFENIGRPIQTNPDSFEWIYNVFIGPGRIKNYIRGIRINRTDGYYIGTSHMSVRSPDASKTQGHNSLLISGGKNGIIADQYLGNSGEHAVRLSSAREGPDNTYPVVPNANQNNTFGKIYVDGSGGCAFKINPTDGDIVSNITIAGIYGKDVGEDLGLSNSELMRFSKCSRVRVGEASAVRVDGSTYAVRCGLRLSNANDVWIGSMILGPTGADGAIRIDIEGDSGYGNVSSIRIGYLEVQRVGSGALIGIANNGYSVSNIYIEDAYFPSLNSADNIITISSTTTIAGPIYLRGVAFGSNQPNFNISPADTDVFVDLRWNNLREIGRPSSFTWKSTLAMTSEAGVLNTGDVANSANGIRMRGANLTVSQGEHFNYIDFGQQGGNRRGPGIAGTQTGTIAGALGATIFRKTTTASDEIFPHTTFRHDGDMEMAVDGSAIILRSANGTRYKLTVDNSGVLGVAPA